MTAETTEADIRAALALILPPRDASAGRSVMGAGNDDVESARAELRKLADGGWMVPSWPVEYGGRGADATQAALIARVLRDFAVPDVYPFMVGLYLVGPTLLEHGTDDQKRRWLRAMASGEEIWCQLFSEPDAGSDLANVATRAVRDGDHWILDGQKVWTSRGHYADWGICIARTDPEQPKHRGLTVFAVRMHAPGVEVRPLVQMNGDRHFSEVFLEGVRVPDSDRIGDVGGGWPVTLTVLAHERRAGQPPAARSGGRSRVPSWLSELARRGATTDPVLRQRAMDVYVLEQVTRMTSARVAATARAGRNPGPAGSGQKLATAKLFRMRTALMTDSLGALGMLSDSPGAVDFLTAPSMSIRGGTDEIQRNIMAERILGLPPEPRLDKDVPWAVSRRGGL